MDTITLMMSGPLDKIWLLVKGPAFYVMCGFFVFGLVVSLFSKKEKDPFKRDDD